jgi:hypothetical protein
MNNEPVSVSAAVVIFVNAVLAMIVGLEVVEWSPEQTALIMGVVVSLVALVGAVFARSRVTPVTKFDPPQ